MDLLIEKTNPSQIKSNQDLVRRFQNGEYGEVKVEIWRRFAFGLRDFGIKR